MYVQNYKIMKTWFFRQEWKSIPSFLTKIMILAVEDGDISAGDVRESLKNDRIKMEDMNNEDYLKDSIKLIINKANKEIRSVLISDRRMHLIILLVMIIINCGKQ